MILSVPGTRCYGTHHCVEFSICGYVSRTNTKNLRKVKKRAKSHSNRPKEQDHHTRNLLILHSLICYLTSRCFLLSRPSVTNRPEFSFAYHMRSSVVRLKAALESVTAQFDQKTPESRGVHWVLRGLTQLDEALQDLERNYGTALQENPSLIWQDTIVEATGSHFWPVWSWDDPRCLPNLEAEVWDAELYTVWPVLGINNTPGGFTL
ncbi:hypothetical protein F5Y16DRAFT_152574 [Xylariaceae sp. FL0255]|nr:hypothetical protein F5Y16DRAFT_152574 [Xylariaceae sp. FL0255]